MLRAPATTGLARGLQSLRHNSGGSAPARRRGFLLPTLIGSGLGIGGVVGYAYFDPSFRLQLEENVPGAKQALQQILGDHSFEKTSAHVSSLADEARQKVTSALPKPKIREGDALPPLNLDRPVDVPKPPKEPVHIEPVDVRKQPAELQIQKPAITQEQIAEAEKKLNDRLLTALRNAEGEVKSATEAKLKTIEAIREHARVLKTTVDAAPDGRAHWEAVTEAMRQAEQLARRDAEREQRARAVVDQLSGVVAEGKASSTTARHPLLGNSAETALKLRSQLDELNRLVEKARSESRVLNDYKELIDQSRRQFADELKSIMPHVNIADQGKLSEDELNALIAHAHLKVDELRRQLATQQVDTEHQIARAVEEQRSTDERIAQQQLELTLSDVRQAKKLEAERLVEASRVEWESELEARLRRAAAAHSEHLEQVVRTQRQLFDMEQQQHIEQAVLEERSQHSRQIGVAISRLEGIETALTDRVTQDAENRRSKQLWIATQNLIESVVHGRKAGRDMDERRLPLKDSIRLLKEASGNDEFVNTVMSTFSEASVEKGVYTEQDLLNRFAHVRSLGLRTAFVDENGGSPLKYFFSYVRSLLLLDLPRKFTNADKIDPVTIDNVEVLARARWHLEQSDWTGAVKVMQLLRGEPARLARDWIDDTRDHLQTRYLSRLLLAHAAVSSIRSTY